MPWPYTEEDAELVQRVAEFVRTYWELGVAPDYEIDLVSRLGYNDPEEFGFFLESFSGAFSLGFYGLVPLQTLTIRDLCAYAKAGEWPREFPS